MQQKTKLQILAGEGLCKEKGHVKNTLRLYNSDLSSTYFWALCWHDKEMNILTAFICKLFQLPDVSKQKSSQAACENPVAIYTKHLEKGK